MKSRVPRKIVPQSSSELSLAGLGGDRDMYSMEFMAGRDDRIKFPSRKNVVVEGVAKSSISDLPGPMTGTAAVSGLGKNLWPQPILQVYIFYVLF
jgi:hypothetical protein